MKRTMIDRDLRVMIEYQAADGIVEFSITGDKSDDVAERVAAIVTDIPDAASITLETFTGEDFQIQSRHQVFGAFGDRVGVKMTFEIDTGKRFDHYREY